jgi:hypothetical protein
MKRSSYFLLITIALLSFNFSSCKKDEAIHDHTALTGLFKVEFEHSFDGAEFSFDSTYIDAQGDTLHFSKFDYYISNLQLVKSDGSIWSQPESYFLIKSSDDLSRLISIADVPAGDYTGINFSIGVDSTHNVSGAQTGALDPTNEMFWDWNTGYIFIKTEGTISTFFQASVFEYHIGGFQTANATNCVRKVSQTFGGSTLTIAPNTAPQIHMAVDLSRFFNGTSDSLSVASMPMIHDPGAEAVKAANRFQEAFEFEHLHQ